MCLDACITISLTSTINLLSWDTPQWTAEHLLSTVGVSGRGVRLIHGEPDGNTSAETSDLDRFRLSDRRNTLCPVSSVDCIEYEMHSRGSLPALYSLEGRVIG